jgi:hypothetical protein
MNAKYPGNVPRRSSGKPTDARQGTVGRNSTHRVGRSDFARSREVLARMLQEFDCIVDEEFADLFTA